VTRRELTVVLTCDVPGCDEELWAASASEEEARQYTAEPNGWEHHGGRDFCFDHVPTCPPAWSEVGERVDTE
jgi:hypothetical protein